MYSTGMEQDDNAVILLNFISDSIFFAIFFRLLTFVNLISGRLSPFHRGVFAIREDIRIHVVQFTGEKEEIFQKA